MPGGPAVVSPTVLLALACGILAGFVLGALLSVPLGARLLAGVRGIWGRRTSRVRFELLEQ